jgi:hypothetical protein
LPPGETVVVPFHLMLFRPGPFTIEVPLFVEDRSGLRTIMLRATGSGRPAVVDKRAAKDEK